MELEQLETVKMRQNFKFGPSTTYPSYSKVKLPMIMTNIHGKDFTRYTWVYILEATSPFLLGYDSQLDWGVEISIKNSMLKTEKMEKSMNFQCSEQKQSIVEFICK